MIKIACPEINNAMSGTKNAFRSTITPRARPCHWAKFPLDKQESDSATPWLQLHFLCRLQVVNAWHPAFLSLWLNTWDKHEEGKVGFVASWPRFHVVRRAGWGRGEGEMPEFAGFLLSPILLLSAPPSLLTYEIVPLALKISLSNP